MGTSSFPLFFLSALIKSFVYILYKLPKNKKLLKMILNSYTLTIMALVIHS